MGDNLRIKNNENYKMKKSIVRRHGSKIERNKNIVLTKVRNIIICSFLQNIINKRNIM